MAEARDLRSYAYEDYVNWPEDERIELIEGEIVLMTPPLSEHQFISVELTYRFRRALEGNECLVFEAPFGVFLDAPQRGRTGSKVIVEPDLVVVCDRSKLKKHGLEGAPDVAVEILSPYTASHDHIRKMKLYEQYGVREYWIVDPAHRIVHVHLLEDDGRYGRAATYAEEDVVPSQVLPDVVIELNGVFPEPELFQER